MACFLVPMAEAVVVDVIRRKILKEDAADSFGYSTMNVMTVRSHHLGWLSQLLWGVSLLLMLEHVWTGEVTLSFPFLTALSSGESAVSMLRELLTVGLPTALLVTFIWVITVKISERLCVILHR